MSKSNEKRSKWQSFFRAGFNKTSQQEEAVKMNQDAAKKQTEVQRILELRKKKKGSK